MNLTFGTLATLKAQLLPSGLTAGTDYDALIASLGRAVAGRFEQACNRKFARVVGDIFECPADRAHVVLPRYPIEEITAIALRTDMETGYVDQGSVNSLLLDLGLASGLVDFGAQFGPARSRLRITYTGGYWLDEFGDLTTDTAAERQQRITALSAGAESLAVTFDAEFAEIPLVKPTIIAPAGGIIISVTPSDVTTTGFTALFGYPIPAAGYSLGWEATTEDSAPVSESLPDGATEVPADLAGAWLMQCEHVWRVRDKLGLSIAEKPEASPAAIATVDLLPDVRDTLSDYTRRTLL